MTTRVSYLSLLVLLATFLVHPISVSACSYPSPSHSPESSSASLRGNDCKTGNIQYGTPTYSSCEDARYIYYSESQHQYYTGISHSAYCTSTQYGSCQACGVPRGHAANCSPLITSTYANYHSLWDKWYAGYAYRHNWYTSSTQKRCACGFHGCS